MNETKPIELPLRGLSEGAKELLIAICNENGCSPDKALVILTNRVAEGGVE